MNSVIIRSAREDDFEAVYHINLSAFGYDYSKADTAKMLSYILNKPNYRIFVAEADGLVVGYIHGSDYECTYNSPLKNILALGVLPEYHGQGLGRMLIEKLENWAKEDGCSGVRLVSGYNRAEAHKFYLHCGYADRKNQKNFIKYF